MLKLFLSSVLLLTSVNTYAKDLHYFHNDKLTVSLTNEKCLNNSYIVRAKVTNYQAIHGCYLVKQGYVFVIWQDKSTSLYKTTDFKPLRSI